MESEKLYETITRIMALREIISRGEGKYTPDIVEAVIKHNRLCESIQDLSIDDLVNYHLFLTKTSLIKEERERLGLMRVKLQEELFELLGRVCNKQTYSRMEKIIDDVFNRYKEQL